MSTASDIRIWVVPGPYPYNAPDEHWKGIFIHREVQALRREHGDVRVVQLRDWFPPWPLWTVDAAWRQAHRDWRPKKRIIDGVRVWHPVVFNPRPSRFFPIPHRDRASARLVSFLRSHRVTPDRDVVLCHWLIPEGYIAARAAAELGLPVAVKMWGDDVALWPFQSPAQMETARWVLEHASALIPCSDYLGRQTLKLSARRAPMQTIYTSVNLDSFKPPRDAEKMAARLEFGLDADDLVLLSVGAAVRRKGWLELFDAVAVLLAEFPKLKLVGVHGGAADLDLDAEAARRGLSEHFVNLRQLPPETLPRVCQAADLFALPSHREGLANAVLEAMATGLPTVTTPVGGHPEVIEPGVNGELVPVDDANALTRTLRALLQHPERWPSYGTHARATVERVAFPAKNARRLLALLDDIRAGRQAPTVATLETA